MLEAANGNGDVGMKAEKTFELNLKEAVIGAKSDIIKMPFRSAIEKPVIEQA
jgi:hypothetical protein